ncbi:chromatin assembly factor 1 subunit A-domain-containing protein [Sporodiniella umbellata]|nr:chromatin assembly factor 1 subunit A-domain-containing protein [Sporodiniella umbellata]
MADTSIYGQSECSNSIDDFIELIGSSPAPIDIDTYLSNISSEAKCKRGSSIKIDIRTLLLSDSENISNAHNVRKALRMKLLQFTEDVRPAYYGTFTQTSDIITGKTPFVLDTKKLDYEADSEAEWEPEGEGEEIRSGDEEEEDADIIDPEDAGWLVPEGYLSDNEGVEGSERPSTRQTNSQRKMVIREIVFGPYYEGESEESDTMKPFALNFSIDNPAEGCDPFYEENPIVDLTENTHPKPEFTEEHKNALISVINEKSPDSIPGIILEAKAHSMLKDVSKRQLEAKIKDVAVKEKRGSDTVSFEL